MTWADRNLLSARKVAALKKDPGLHRDGGNLYLQVKANPNGRTYASWIFRYRSALKDRKITDMGLGPLVDVGLAEARQKARESRAMLREGLDPLHERRRKRQEALQEAIRALTFRDAGKAYIATHAPSWRNEKHQNQWENTLATYAYPTLGNIDCRDIDVDDVLNVLRPIWLTKHETARRLRSRIERVLDYAKSRQKSRADNPAAWERLKHQLPKEAATAPPRHHPALPYDDIHDFVRGLRQQTGVAALALEFTILTACRTNEVVNATWDEFNGVAWWTIPGERMKSGKPHRVPLSKPALDLLARLREFDGPYVFPGLKRGRKAPGALSNMAMLQVLKRMGRGDLTVHGFRSTFRDWAAETTAYPNIVAEMALAHAIPDKVEAAYRRGELLTKRERMMADWAKYIARKPRDAKVTPIRSTRGR